MVRVNRWHQSNIPLSEIGNMEISCNFRAEKIPTVTDLLRTYYVNDSYDDLDEYFYEV